MPSLRLRTAEPSTSAPGPAPWLHRRRHPPLLSTLSHPSSRATLATELGRTQPSDSRLALTLTPTTDPNSDPEPDPNQVLGQPSRPLTLILTLTLTLSLTLTSSIKMTSKHTKLAQATSVRTVATAHSEG
eukprot:scaffold81239_cov54-Phaeocystis_antarctica.AAC.2